MTEQRFEARDEETNSEYLYSLTSAISENERLVTGFRDCRDGVSWVSVGRRQLPAHALTGKRQEGGDREGRAREGQKFRSTRYRSRSRVVEIPCDYAWDCGSRFSFCSLFLFPAVPLWRPLPRVQGPRAERLGRSPAVVALFPYAVVVLGFSSMSGLMLESGALSSP